MQNVRDISAKELKDYISKKRENDYLLIDVREPKEYAANHIPGAVLVPLKHVELAVLGFDQDKELIFYCRSGRRSKIAANFVSDLDLAFPAIYNLAGGILSWQGKGLAGFPRLALFPMDAPLDEILLKAIELEKGAETFYEVCAQELEQPDLKESAASLAKLETGHAKAIYQILKGIKPDIEEFGSIYARAKGEIMEGGIEVSVAILNLMAAEGDPCVNFSEMALEIEFRAYDLYKTLAARSNTSEETAIFLRLSEQEKAHARLIASRLSECLAGD